MFATFRTELAKQWRRPRTYVALGLTVAVPIIIAIALKANPPSAPGDGGGGGGFFFFGSTITGLLLPVAALRVMSRFLLVVVVALFAGDAIASESSWGNLRALLTRPIGRSRLLASKFATVCLFTLLATSLVVIAGLAAGGIGFGWHAVDIPQLGLHFTTANVIGNLVLAVLYVSWSLGGVVALSFMVSTMTDAPAGAVFSGVGLYIVSQILDGITSIPQGVRNVMPTHYFDVWADLFEHGGSAPDMWKGVLLQVPYILVPLGIAWWWFRRKDILS
jgi:ABC-2 type transport system permease protein